MTSDFESDLVKEGPRLNRLLSLELTSFRGFNKTIRLNFDASAILINGANGSGKTSVFDGLQWLLTGEIPRLRPWQLRKADEYLVNAYARVPQAIIEARFSIKGVPVRAIRRGTSRSSVLEVEDAQGRHLDAEAELVLARHLAPGELPLSEVLHTSGLLQQDELRKLLQTKPDARYKQLMRLLGLEAVEHFERVTAARRKQAANARSQALEASVRAQAQSVTAREQLETSILQVDRASSSIDLRSRLERVTSEFTSVLIFPQVSELQANMNAVLDETGQLRRRVEFLLTVEGRLPDVLPSGGEAEVKSIESEIERATAQASLARAALEAATQAHRAAEVTHDAVTRLAAVALPFLQHNESGPTPCPVCETLIDHEAVSARLIAKATDAESVADSQAALNAASSSQRLANSELERLVASRTDVMQKRERRADAIDAWIQLHELLPVLQTGTYVRSVSLPSPDDPSTLDPEFLNMAYASVQDQRPTLRSMLGQIRNASGQLELSLRDLIQEQVVARMTAERAGSLPRLRESLERLEEAAALCAAEHEEARRVEQSAAALSLAATSAAAEIFRDRFAALEPLMNDVYARLDPHPSFSHLSFSVESFRSRGTATAIVTDSERGITINPLLIFSSAQANIVVLAAFLALGWAAGHSGLPFLLLDDPMQALDDVNVLGFADLARFVRRERQLILATHEQRFAGLLERKLSGRRAGEDLLVHDFVGWSRSGPEIETRRLEPVEVPSRVLASEVA